MISITQWAVFWQEKSNEILIHVTPWMSLENAIPREKEIVTEDHLLHDSIYMKGLEQANLYGQKADYWLSRAGGGGIGQLWSDAKGTDFFFG